MTSALDGGEWSASRPGRALSSGKWLPASIVQEAGWSPEPVWTQRLEEKILSPLPGIEPRSPGRPVRSQTLYCVLCTVTWYCSWYGNWFAIRVTTLFYFLSSDLATLLLLLALEKNWHKHTAAIKLIQKRKPSNQRCNFLLSSGNPPFKESLMPLDRSGNIMFYFTHDI
jgi:hypothetical protein